MVKNILQDLGFSHIWNNHNTFNYVALLNAIEHKLRQRIHLILGETKEFNIRAPVLLNLLNSLRKRDQMLGKPRLYLLSSTRLINSIKHEHSCKIFYMSYSDPYLTFFNLLTSQKSCQ